MSTSFSRVTDPSEQYGPTYTFGPIRVADFDSMVPNDPVADAFRLLRFRQLPDEVVLTARFDLEPQDGKTPIFLLSSAGGYPWARFDSSGGPLP